MTKKKENCCYELLCLLNENKCQKMIEDMEKILGKENIEKIEKKDWKPAFQPKHLTGQGNYVLIYFNSEREKVRQLKEDILKSIPNHLLLNLTDEKGSKIKLTKKDAK